MAKAISSEFQWRHRRADTPIKCNSWSSLVNQNHPIGNGDSDEEQITQQELDRSCPSSVGRVTGFQCMDDRNEPFANKINQTSNGGLFVFTCNDVHQGLKCWVTDKVNGKCPDFSVQFYCNCSQTGDPTMRSIIPSTTITLSTATDEFRTTYLSTTETQSITILPSTTSSHSTTTHVTEHRPSSKKTTLPMQQPLYNLTKTEMPSVHNNTNLSHWAYYLTSQFTSKKLFTKNHQSSKTNDTQSGVHQNHISNAGDMQPLDASQHATAKDEDSSTWMRFRWSWLVILFCLMILLSIVNVLLTICLYKRAMHRRTSPLMNTQPPIVLDN
ncbi:hypothetical protein DPMN_101357 [Dreissena polymorpha]|uniref:Uncharacterized protein n=2 Tax=Dreissena polymorpha TaxID=45954 RepID=A0A9D4LIL2_DREPO|nr:hypothetical protein DPMN_101357 [Dreissena polymorpha]